MYVNSSQLIKLASVYRLGSGLVPPLITLGHKDCSSAGHLFTGGGGGGVVEICPAKFFDALRIPCT